MVANRALKYRAALDKAPGSIMKQENGLTFGSKASARHGRRANSAGSVRARAALACTLCAIKPRQHGSIKMKIKSIGLQGFRGYSNRIDVDFPNLRVLVGKNDIGKSTILEALDIFFNEGKGSVKLDKEDINKANLQAGNNTIEMSVEFEDLPSTIIIDSSNETTLSDEYLLTSSNTLKVIKRFPNAGAAKVYIKANHPTADGCKDLLLKKNTELKKDTKRSVIRVRRQN
jgi:hypothetical protein